MHGEDAQIAPPFVVFWVALIFIVAGIIVISGGGIGLGLILIGVGCLIGGFGGSAEFGAFGIYAGGVAGAVLIIAGAVFLAFITYR